jgi:uncharacterized protein YegP (UPF0339 family)
MSKFQITKRSNGNLQFNLVASNGQTILTSQGYTDKKSCKAGIDSVKKNAVKAEQYETLVAKNGKNYFVLKATNKQVVGTSQMYASSAGCRNGMKSVMKNGPIATTEDLSE